MAKTLLERIDWPKFSNLIIAKIGAMRLAAEKFPDGPAKAQYSKDIFEPVFLLLMEVVECTGGEEGWSKFSPEQQQMLRDHATAPIGTPFPADLTVTLHGIGGNRIGEG